MQMWLANISLKILISFNSCVSETKFISFWPKKWLWKLDLPKPKISILYIFLWQRVATMYVLRYKKE